MKTRRSALTLMLVVALSGCGREGYTPGKGEIMAATQARHQKLGLAGQNENWPLVEFELHELEEGFGDVAVFHPELADLLSRHVDAPLHELHEAAGRKDAVAFAIAYDLLTNACNACHGETGFGFIAIVRPDASLFPNQDFAPQKLP